MPQPHGPVQFRFVHSSTVILDGDVAVDTIPDEPQIDVSRAGRNAVVNDVRECGCC